MTTNENPTYGQINRSIRQLIDSGQANTSLPGSGSGAPERLVQVYAALKPLLTMLAMAPFLRPVWRKGIAVLNATIESVVANADDDVPASFKAGKDL